MNLAVLTACCYSTLDPIWMLTESVKRFGIKLVTFGLGTNDSDWISIKIHRMMVAARELKERGFTHMLYTDGRDSFFVGPLEECELRYATIGSPPMLMSAEVNPYPFPDLGPKFPDPGTPWRYPCAGQFLCEIDWLLDKYAMLIEECSELEGNDQGWIMWAYAKGLLGEGFELDHTCLLFQSMEGANDPGELGRLSVWSLSQNRLRNNLTTAFPLVLHFNGGYTDPVTGKADRMFPWWKALEMDK